MTSKSICAELNKDLKLEGQKNFDLWKVKIQFLLNDDDLVEYLTTERPAIPDEGTSAAHRRDREVYDAWAKRNRKACYIMLSSMHDDLMVEYHKIDTAKAIWEKLEIDFGGTSLVRLRNLVLKFELYRMDAKLTIPEHLRKISGMIRELKEAGHPLSDEMQVMAVIRSLPDSWVGMKQIMAHNESIKTFADISRHVELEAERQEVSRPIALIANANARKPCGAQRRSKGQEGKQGGAKMGPKDAKITKAHRGKRGGKKDLSKVKCFNCNKMGHFARDCTEPKKGD